MKVYWPGPDQKTYHPDPELGYMERDKPFDLEDEKAKKYIKSGLLKEIKEKPKKKEE